MIQKKEFFPALTGIRAVAVYMIFFKHLNFFDPGVHPRLNLLVNQFYAFLSFFFVLSGFLIYHRYREIQSLNNRKLYNYFISRISRVFPILIILITITFLLGFREGSYRGWEAIKLYLLNITLTKGFSSELFLTGIGPSWSLSVEELFYILCPVIFIFTRNRFSLIPIVLFFYLIGFIITYIFIYNPSHGFFSDYFFTANYTFFGRVFEFACGIYIALLLKRKTILTPGGKFSKAALYIGLIIIFGSIALLLMIAEHLNLKQATESWYGVAVNNFMMPIGISFLFYSLIFYKSYLQRFLASKIMVQLGFGTYSFYLLHTTFVLSYVFKFISTNVFIAFISMIIISFVFYKTVEQPFVILMRNKLHKA
jgi:peptidoglycan/LPS O-acetylase OafA/YrhL